MKNLFSALLLTIILFSAISRQVVYADSLDFVHRWEHSTFPTPTLSLEYDKLDRPYFYATGNQGGLMIFEATDPWQPELIKTMPISDFNDMHVMDVFQEGTYLYLAIGNHFSSDVEGGIAIVDINDPPNAVVKDTWHTNAGAEGRGSAVVRVDGNYAYLGAMSRGMLIFDISDPGNIDSVSQIIPDMSFPNPNPAPAQIPNARGMAVRDEIVYLCYDAGGLRIINIADKTNPRETGRYHNPLVDHTVVPMAYNNVVVDENLAFIPIDYCGLEIVDISDTSNITQVSWWNPWRCETPENIWFNSPGHTNQIAYLKEQSLAFLSAGDSELQVIDVSNPALPKVAGSFGEPENQRAVWGLEVHQNQVLLTYIPALIPFVSNWAGVQLLEWNSVTVGIEETEANPNLPQATSLHQNYPNPFNPVTNIEFTISDGSTSLTTGFGYVELKIYDISGQLVKTLVNEFKPAGSYSITWDGRNEAGQRVVSGVYFYRMMAGDFIKMRKMLLTK